MNVCWAKVTPVMQTKLSQILTAQVKMKLFCLEMSGVELKFRCRWQQLIHLAMGVAGPWQRWMPLGWGAHLGPKPPP